MYITKGAYMLFILLEIAFIGLDTSFNVATLYMLIRKNNMLLLFLFIAQDGFQLLAVVTLFTNIFKTVVFTAGFMDILLGRFRVTIILSIVYFMLTVLWQTLLLVYTWTDPYVYLWGSWMTILFITHRIVSVLYYYFYKRSALRLGDPRYYDEEWIKHTLSHPN